MMAKLFAQTEALAFGSDGMQSDSRVTGHRPDAHRHIAGNRPSNNLLAGKLTPEVLGALISLYEHSIFTQGAIWNINSFDQWGVELGKVLAQRMLPELERTGCGSVHGKCTTTHIPDSGRWIKSGLALRIITEHISGSIRCTPRTRKAPAMISVPHSPRQNRLLAALPAAEYEEMLPELELLSLPLGWAAHEDGGRQCNVYFPTDSVVSLIYTVASGNLTEVAVTGNDGLVGIPLVMGGDATLGRAVVRSAGFAYRMKYSFLKRKFGNGGPLQDLLLRYIQSLMTQISQNAVCNRHHTVEQRLCRWLLMSADRLPTKELATTQELIASMLGVRREGVTEAAGRLQEGGMIKYSRGRVTILDRPKLERWACECYAVVRSETDRLLAPRSPSGRLAIRNVPATSRVPVATPVYASAQPSPGTRSMIGKA